VVEVGHLETRDESAKVRAQISAGKQAHLDRRLAARLDRAALILTGKVTEVKAAVRAEKARPSSEHDPEWQEAVIQVEKVEKGKLDGNRVTVLFAASRDIRWYGSPKLKVVQEGTFLLHKGDDKKELNVKGFVVVDPLDVQPKDQLERVRKLLKK